VAPPVGALVSAVLTAVPVEVAERLVRELELVEARVCELNVLLRDIGTPVPIEAPVVMEVIVEFIIDDVKVDVPE
jgi:hypothetical protein